MELASRRVCLRRAAVDDVTFRMAGETARGAAGLPVLFQFLCGRGHIYAFPGRFLRAQWAIRERDRCAVGDWTIGGPDGDARGGSAGRPARLASAHTEPGPDRHSSLPAGRAPAGLLWRAAAYSGDPGVGPGPGRPTCRQPDRRDGRP